MRTRLITGRSLELARRLDQLNKDYNREHEELRRRHGELHQRRDRTMGELMDQLCEIEGLPREHTELDLDYLDEHGVVYARTSEPAAEEETVAAMLEKAMGTAREH